MSVSDFVPALLKMVDTDGISGISQVSRKEDLLASGGMKRRFSRSRNNTHLVLGRVESCRGRNISAVGK